MRKTFYTLVVGILSLEVGIAAATPTGHSTLRNAPLAIELPAPTLPKTTETEGGYQRKFTQQPPLIPHSIRGYQQTKDANTCLMCHNQKSGARWGAKPAHYKTVDGKQVLDNSRYFCLQCHVPQAEAKPLLNNHFKGTRTPISSDS